MRDIMKHHRKGATWGFIVITSYSIHYTKLYEDLVLPSAVTDEQGKLLQELYVGSITVDQFIARMDEVFQQANALN